MDLVDIDQVLDNLELREAADELNKTASVDSVQSALPNGNGAVSIQHTVENTILGDGASNNIKNFVAVSQVFHSLDDYRNDVKTLEVSAAQNYDEDCRIISPNSFAENNKKQCSTAGATSVPDHVKSENSSIGSPSFNALDVFDRKRTNDVQTADENDDVDELSESEDIHRFIEGVKSLKSRSKEGQNSTNNSTSDSLTTSSSSTFSSGPSPGHASTTEEHSPITPELDSRQTSALQLQQNSQSTCVSQVEKGAALDDLALGLSSISITTLESNSILPCEPTISSALGKVLGALSETVETVSSESQLRQYASTKQNPDDNSKSIVTASASYLEQENGVQNEYNPNVNRDDIILNRAPGKEPGENKKQITDQHPQPITFCSTMDDISDTELDSMFQEMDIDDIAEPNLNITSTTKNDNEEFEELKDSAVDKVVATMKTAQITASADHSNADNFSQASTVEFSEIKTNIQNQEEDVASSYTSTESDSLSGRHDDTENQDDLDPNSLRPQRPKTLDLPTVNMNRYANAGQTPPGNNVTLDNGEVQSVNGSDVDNAATAANNESINNVYEDSENGSVSEGNENDAPNAIEEATGYSDPHANLGKIPPIWVPDNMATSCMQCHQKFTMIKRRHHCRACGKVLCSICCSQRYKLEFQTEPESRVCVQCFSILSQREDTSQAVVTEFENQDQETPSTPTRSPNPNNPMEYCSTIPPHRQVSAAGTTQPPSVIVPVGVLKKEGSYSSNSSNSSGKKGRKRKSVMFSDGIAPGSELASSMEQQWGEAKHARRVPQSGERSRSTSSNKPPTPGASEPRSIDATTMGLVAQLFRGSIPPSAAAAAINAAQGANEETSSNINKDCRGNISNQTSPRRKGDQRLKKVTASSNDQGCYIPDGDNCLPPICPLRKGDNIRDSSFKDVSNDFDLVERLQRETLTFWIKNNFYVLVKIVNLDCCMNRTVINFTTSGMHHVGNDEIVILLEYQPPEKKEDLLEPAIPKDIFIHLHEIYREAEAGRPISELSFSSPSCSNFLGSRENGGLIYIRATYQCLQDVIKPDNPYLIGILIHRHEVPWAKVFPLRLMLRLGAQYRYYPCPHISMRNRNSVYAEIAQTIINFLADFRNFSYTLPSIRGLYIHMEDRQTTVLIPRNRQEDIIKAINNASDHILAFGGNFSKTADGHLVCMQNVNDDRSELYAYSTQAINIQGQPRKVTGASFFVLNEALKTTSGLSGKCSIVEDGLMVQILPTKMEEVRNALRNQNDIDIVCGPLEANEEQTEVVSIKWVDNDRDFNIGVKSPIDEKSMEGISSMRVHASFNYSNANYSIRLTDIYIMKFDEWYNAVHATLAATSSDVTRIAEQIARSASMALVPFLDLLAASGIFKIGLRATLDQENVCYEAGARGVKLPPLYMNALDNHLIPTLHNESSGVEDAIVLELVFYILNV